MKEAQMQTKFGGWLKRGEGGKIFCGVPCVFELKICKSGRALAFNRLADHQEGALLESEDGGRGVYYKLSDLSVGAKPFDCFWFSGARGYVVCGWHEGGVGVRVYLIRIKEWLLERDRLRVVGRKSLKEERAGEIGTYIGIL